MMSKLIDAGASSVVGTLWNVEDHESYEFMTLFYGNLIRSKGSVSQALQKAQIEMSRDHAYNQWAPFILYQK
ncbi:MAG: CHAT domain-containing protein [Gammaproteobacteria bacterium]|nr:CHAT domain-containing protein [Gammaproteobacteria bacterium]